MSALYRVHSLAVQMLLLVVCGVNNIGACKFAGRSGAVCFASSSLFRFLKILGGGERAAILQRCTEKARVYSNLPGIRYAASYGSGTGGQSSARSV